MITIDIPSLALGLTLGLIVSCLVVCIVYLAENIKK